jgi:hypothetical protein
VSESERVLNAMAQWAMDNPGKSVSVDGRAPLKMYTFEMTAAVSVDAMSEDEAREKLQRCMGVDEDYEVECGVGVFFSELQLPKLTDTYDYPTSEEMGDE